MYSNVIVSNWMHRITPLIYGDEECKPGHTYGPAVREYYLLHYIMSGKGKLFKSGKCYEISTDEIFVIRPGEITTYTADNDNPWHYVWLGFSCDIDLPFLSSTVLNGLSLRNIFERIGNCSKAGGDDISVYSSTFELLKLIHGFKSECQDDSTDYAKYLKMYMDNAYMHAISIDKVATTLHINRRYLTALFRLRYGVPPRTYLINLRLKHAQAFLKQGTSVTNVAIMTGFNDLSDFSRRYKLKFGHSPRDERS